MVQKSPEPILSPFILKGLCVSHVTFQECQEEKVVILSTAVKNKFLYGVYNIS